MAGSSTSGFRAVALACAIGLLVLADSGRASSLLPASGRVLIELETVCHVADKVNVRAATLTGNISDGAAYPFSVERLYYNALVRTLAVSNSELYVITDIGSCVRETSGVEKNDNVVFWNMLRQLLTSVFSSSQPSDEVVLYRGIPSRSRSGSITTAVPVGFGGSGTSRTFTVQFLVNAKDVSLNFQSSIEDSPLTVVLTASEAEACTLTFSFFGTDTTSNKDLSPPSWCDNALTSSAATRQKAARLRTPATAPARQDAGALDASDSAGSTGALAFPLLPDEFSANFQVIDPRKKAVYFMRNSFNLEDKTCYTTLRDVVPDAVGRMSLYEWYVLGTTQLTYYHASDTVVDSTRVINRDVQEYFWPDTERCDRSLIGYNLFPSSGSQFLMLDNLETPMFVGNRTARGIPCGVWSAPVKGARVSWYFASDPAAFDDDYDFSTGTSAPSGSDFGQLVRIAVEGFGTAAAFVVHHPFFPPASAFPPADRWMACHQLASPRSTDGCVDMPEDTFFFFYDVTSFVPYVPFSDESVPEACASTLTGSAFPSTTCAFQGGIHTAAAAVLLLLIAILFFFVGSCCMWCRFAPMVRGLQEDMIALVEELRRKDESPPGDGNGGEEASTQERVA